jgi:1-acyl-sn-glycerol-3-phosphate acyltransferase
MCTNLGAECLMLFDGFYPVTLILVFFGLLWLIFTKKIIDYLQNLPKTEWMVTWNKEEKQPSNGAL